HYTPTTQIYTLSLHDALPISFRHRSLMPETSRMQYVGAIAILLLSFGCKTPNPSSLQHDEGQPTWHGEFDYLDMSFADYTRTTRSEEHTSELQSRENLVCRLL